MKIAVRPLSRVFRDPQNNVIRSYFDSRGTTVDKAADPESAAEQLLADNLDEFGWAPSVLDDSGTNRLVTSRLVEGGALQSVRFQQRFHDVPVDGAIVVVNISKSSGDALSLYNNYDYEIPEDFDTKPGVSVKSATKRVVESFKKLVRDVKPKDAGLVVYRHGWTEVDWTAGRNGKRGDDAAAALLGRLDLPALEEHRLYLVWRMIIDVEDPIYTSIEVLVDAREGNLIAARDRAEFVDGEGWIFYPDPVTTSGTTNLVTTTPGKLTPTATFDAELKKNAVLKDLDAADASGKYHLKGPYCRISDDEAPTHSPPEEGTPAFKYSTDKKDFLAVNCYFWIDTIQRHIKNDIAVPNAGDYQIEVDPQGLSGADNSHFVPGTTSGNGRIAFGEGGAPDASDTAVVLHEYGHAVQDHQSFSGAMDLREGFCDLFAHVYLDRYNKNKVMRGHVFPFDNNPSASYYWNPKRRVDLTDKYSDTGYSGYGSYHKGSIWASTVWDMYLSLGGDNVYEAHRKWAADVVLKLLLEANVAYGTLATPSSGNAPTHQRMAQAMETADAALSPWGGLPNGLFHKVIYDRCVGRDLYDPLAVDVYIDDGRNGGYDFQQVFWEAPDLVVRRSASDSPSMGYQEPIVNAKNYLWVRVKRKGTGAPGAVNVKAFHCSPGTGLVWPTHWSSMSPPSLPATTLGTAFDEWVGPFEFIPTQVGHACVLAIAEAANDPANTQGMTGSVPHWKLVPFDNNIAQRNLHPVKGSGPKQERKFRIINSTDRKVIAKLEVERDLPEGWRLEFDVPDIRNIPLSPFAEQWVTLRTIIPEGLDLRDVGDRGSVRIVAVVDGIPEGGMSFDFVHPSVYGTVETPGAHPQKPCDCGSCCACLGGLLEGAEVEGEIKIDIRFRKKR